MLTRSEQAGISETQRGSQEGGSHSVPHHQSLLDVSQAILQHRDLNGLFRDLAVRLRAIVPFDFLNLVLYDAATNTMRLHILESTTDVEPHVPEMEFPPEESPSGWVYVHQAPLVIPDVNKETRWPKIMDVLKRNRVLSSAWLPLTTAQHRLGALMFGFQSGVPLESQLDFMRQVSAQVAVAVDNALNFENAEKYQRQLARERDRLQVLLEITTALVSELDIRELFPTVTACLRRVMPSEYASLALLEEGGAVLKNHALVFEGNPAIIPQGATAALDATPAGQAVQTRRPAVFDGRQLARFSSPLAQRLAAAGLQSLCCIPLITRNGVLGTLNIASTKENAFTPADVDFLTQVAGQAAIAIENATAFAQIAQLKDRLAEEKLYLQDEIRTDQNFGEIIGDDPAFRHVLDQVATVAPTGASVMILGETGTGKELIARAIHDLSGRHDRTFVKLNCAAIPTGLLESELFGHEKGAFTGAIAQKVGRFELAHKGTLFLDEVGDIPLELQPKLLRALQEHEFERLGSVRTLKVDVRLVAATNRDLSQMIANREFRSDLYYRLSVFPISVPPLRERTGDIPKLVRYFTQKFARRMNRRIETIPSAAMEALTNYAWPGNVRELENLIERAVILTRGSALEIPLAELRGTPDPAASPLTLEDAERDHIKRVLEQAGGVVGGPNGAAARLGMKRTTLQSKMKKLGIVR
ncbi:MAG TPA: sigma 54-interacting transcriptional regulator [Bryobacteraceae bacterium]|nr:sigma 54-interacting transcriptional regulator [Bryobacteraceae bacterium]